MTLAFEQGLPLRKENAASFFFVLLRVCWRVTATMKTWSYALPKEQLAMLAAAYGLEDTGTLDEIRKSVRGYAEEYPEEFASDPREFGEPSTATPKNFVSGPTFTDCGVPSRSI